MPGVLQKKVFCLNAITDENGHNWETKMNQEEDSVNTGVRFSKHVSRARSITNTKKILRYVQKPDIRWTIDQTEFDETVLKKDSAPGLDGIPYDAYRCAGALGSQFFKAHKFLLERGTVPDYSVFIPKTSVHDNGRIIRSPDALRPLTLLQLQL